MRDIVAAELCLREPLDPARLNGCGMLVINPPYRFEARSAADPATLCWIGWATASPAKPPR